MTIDKIQPAALSVAREAKADALAGRQQQNAAVQQQTMQRSADVAVLPVKVSAAAKEMAQAVRQVAGDEAFDQKKVDRIRKEILEGRFPMDEERLARKFMELENELGETALHLACREGHKAVIERLLLARANANICDVLQGNTPLHILALANH